MVVAQADVEGYVKLHPDVAVSIRLELIRIQLALQADLADLIGWNVSGDKQDGLPWHDDAGIECERLLRRLEGGSANACSHQKEKQDRCAGNDLDQAPP